MAKAFPNFSEDEICHYLRDPLLITKDFQIRLQQLHSKLRPGRIRSPRIYHRTQLEGTLQRVLVEQRSTDSKDHTPRNGAIVADVKENEQALSPTPCSGEESYRGKPRGGTRAPGTPESDRDKEIFGTQRLVKALSDDTACVDTDESQPKTSHNSPMS